MPPASPPAERTGLLGALSWPKVFNTSRSPKAVANGRLATSVGDKRKSFLGKRMSLSPFSQKHMVVQEVIDESLSPRSQVGRVQELLASLHHNPKQKEIFQLRKEIILLNKQKFIKTQALKELDKKIKLLVLNNISVQDLERRKKTSFAQHARIIEEDFQLKYDRLFGFLYFHPEYLAKLASIYRGPSSSPLVQIVVFTIYGDQFSRREQQGLLALFEHMIEEEIRDSDLGSFLRGNTAVTTMLTACARREAGAVALAEILSPVFKELLKDGNIDLEVNPAKVYASLYRNSNVTDDEAAENPQVKKITAQRIEKLEMCCRTIVDRIVEMAHLLPYETRMICRLVEHAAKTKFPRASENELESLVGGFLFLRYFNPAIVAPTGFGIVSDRPNPETTRSLILIAKVIQNLSNNVKFGGKETYLAPLNPFLDSYASRKSEYLRQLLLPHEEDLPSFVGPNDDDNVQFTVDILVNEIRLLHELLQSHLDQLAPSKTDPLRSYLLDAGAPGPKVSPKDNRGIVLNLSVSQGWEMPQPTLDVHPDDQLASELMLILASIPPIHTFCPKGVSVLEGLSMLDLSGKSIMSPRSTGGKGETQLLELLESFFETRLQTRGPSVASRHDEPVGSVVRQPFPPEVEEKMRRVLNRVKKLLIDQAERHGEKELPKLKAVKKKVELSVNALDSSMDMYQSYLKNVQEQTFAIRESRSSSAATEKKGSDGALHFPSKHSPGSFGYKESKLKAKGVLTVEKSSWKRKRCKFWFVAQPNAVGLIHIVLTKGKSVLWQVEVEVTDLLERKMSGQTVYQPDAMRRYDERISFNLTSLIDLLNKKFISTNMTTE